MQVLSVRTPKHSLSVVQFIFCPMNHPNVRDNALSCRCASIGLFESGTDGGDLLSRRSHATLGLGGGRGIKLANRETAAFLTEGMLCIISLAAKGTPLNEKNGRQLYGL